MLNPITYASLLIKNLSTNIINKYDESKDSFLDRVSARTGKEIQFLEHNTNELIHSQIEKYADGMPKIKENYYNLLTEDEVIEFKSLIDTKKLNEEEISYVRQSILRIAFDAQQKNEGQVVGSTEVHYLKIFNSLPDFITQDIALLTKEDIYFNNLTAEDIDLIKNFPSKLDPKLQVELDKEIKEFVDAHKDEKLEQILSTLYALDFLTDF